MSTTPASRARRAPRKPRTAPSGQQSWWGIVTAAALISAATAPGQTAGLSPFTDPLIEQLGLSRTAISTSYLIGTLAGAAALPFIGRGIDRWGPRKVITIAALTFSIALFLLSFVTEIYGLTAGFVILRMAGQGTLTLAATTAVVKAIHHRRGLAVGITAAVGSAGISLTPVIVDRLIVDGGIGFAWQVQSMAVLVVVLPLVFLLPRHKVPAVPPVEPGDQAADSTGILPARDDGDSEDGAGAKVWSSRAAARTPIFWAIAAALATTGMLSTALAFHQVSILTAQGLTSTQAAANFIPQTVTGIIATLALGAFAHRLDPRVSLALSMLLLGVALVFLPFITGTTTAILYGLILGAATGAVRAVEPIALAEYFGTESIGSIRGLISSINVGSTALGPIVFSLGLDFTGSYAVPSFTAAALPAAVAVFALICPVPGRRRHRLLRPRRT